MKKFTKIALIAAGIIGVGKYLKDHVKVEVVQNGKIPEKEQYKNKANFYKRLYEIERDKNKEKESFKMNGSSFGHCDHIYYDNPYNICQIFTDNDGCPMTFKFENKTDQKRALNTFLLDCISFDGDDIGFKWSLDMIFSRLGLIIDDYEDFKDYYTAWTARDLSDAQNENADPLVIDFGQMEYALKSQK